MSIRDIARAKQTISTLMEGREKLETKDLIGEELHINAVEVVSPFNKEPYIVCTTTEYPQNFFFAGSVLQELVYAVMAEVDGIENLNDELAKEPLGIKMEMRQAKTPNSTGRKCSYTAIEIL